MKILKILETVKNFIKKNKKLVTVVSAMFCAVVLVAGSIAGTIAYLTSETDVVKNTFTVGKITITLDEAKVTAYGAQDGDTRVKENEYKLIPGHEYKKDPTIHVTKGSEACWLFVKVEDGLKNIEDATTIADQLVANGWTLVDGTTNIYWHAIVDASEAVKDIDVKVFETFKLKGDAKVDDYATAEIKVTAYAVQSNGFTTDADDAIDAKNAWLATFGA